MTRTALAALFLVACTDVPNTTPDDVVSRTDLSSYGELAGVTVEPDSGRRLALISDLVYVVGADGVEVLGVQPPNYWGFTDMVAVGDGMIALSAQSNGYLFDTESGSFVQHFCYEPGWEEEQQDTLFQITFALGFDIDRGQLVAQPHTATTDAPDDPTESFVATYDRQTGADLSWYTMPQATYRAGGMAVATDSELWLGVDDHLDVFDDMMARPSRLASLAGADITDITGMAFDESNGTLLVADSAGELVEIRLDAIDER